MDFNEEDLAIIEEAKVEIAEFHYEYRKQISQRKYVFEIKAGTYIDWAVDEELSIPDHLVGLWIMRFARDLQYDNLSVCIRDDSWVKCAEVQEIITTYVPVEDL
jgi:hypothetical protein